MKKLMNTLEVFAKAMVQPLMYLSVAGMILAIGSVLTNSSVTAFLPFLQWGPIQVIGKLMYEDVEYIINGEKIGEVTQKLYDILTGIQWGELPDEYGWVHKL